MADRSWEVNIEGDTHTVHLRHGHYLGKREIWLDGQRIFEGRQLVDRGSQHQFLIGSSSCELGITTNGITFDYYLLLDGLPVETPGSASSKKSRATKTSLSEVAHWQNLADISHLNYVVIPNVQGFMRHRLIGFIDNYLVIVRLGVIPSTGQVMISILVRFAPLINSDVIKPQLKTELIDKEITDKKHIINQFLDIQRDFALILLPYQQKKETPESMSSKINLFIKSLSKYASPLRDELCEGIDCKLRIGQDLRLVFINDYPFQLCDKCIENIAKLAEKDKEEYQKAPLRLGRGVLVGILAALIGGVLWAAVAVFLNSVAAAMAALILVLVVKGMDKVGTKRTIWSILVAGLLGLIGVVFGVYLSVVFYILKNYQGQLPLEILQIAWRFLWEDRRILNLSLIFGMLGILPYLWAVWSAQKQQFSRVFKPEVEILNDFRLDRNEMMQRPGNNPQGSYK